MTSLQVNSTRSRKDRLKILVLIKSLGLGGAERLLVDALPYLDQNRFAYTFAYLLPWKDFLVPQIKAAGAVIHCLGTIDHGQQTTDNRLEAAGGGWRAARILPVALQRLDRLQKQQQFDLIHAHLPVAGILARAAGRWYGLPVFYTEHNLQERYHPLTRWLNRITYGWNRQVLAVSEEVTASMARFGMNQKSQVITLQNGVAVEQVRAEARDLNGLREELGIPNEHLVVGTVAVFRRQKRLLDWLEIAAQTMAQRDDVTFLLVGHGPEEANIKAKAQNLGLAERVRMPGFRSDGRRVLGLVDVYLMSSEFEGLPIALLEAMALGKPVVVTAVGGIPEVVQDGQEGFLAPVGATDELATHTIQLLANPELRQRMGQRGASKVAEKFHWQDRVRAVESLYLEVLGKMKQPLEIKCNTLRM